MSIKKKWKKSYSYTTTSQSVQTREITDQDTVIALSGTRIDFAITLPTSINKLVKDNSYVYLDIKYRQRQASNL